jgi:hypothetical protein
VTNRNVNVRCRLCLDESSQLCNSHIIPELCFDPLYDPEKRNFIELNISTGRVRKHQKGFRERLLCANCESVINNYEKHARRLFVDPLPTPRSGSKMLFDYPQIDYSLIRLYAMSLAWRASVSSLDIFNLVDLGPHEELFRKHLLGGIAPEANRFPCAIFRIVESGEHFIDFMTNPTYAKLEGHRYYRFVVRGFLFFVFASQGIPKDMEPLMLAPDKPVFVMNTDFHSHKFLSSVWNAGRNLNLPDL